MPFGKIRRSSAVRRQSGGALNIALAMHHTEMQSQAIHRKRDGKNMSCQDMDGFLTRH